VLTLATAFLAAGAATVVGARWEIRDEHTSVLMYMFHHYLLRENLPPADALRSAPLWMFDPRRGVPAEMPEALRARVSQRLARVIFWAGFTHQGQ
jgi:CHAT domain-containing protein